MYRNVLTFVLKHSLSAAYIDSVLGTGVRTKNLRRHVITSRTFVRIVTLITHSQIVAALMLSTCCEAYKINIGLLQGSHMAGGEEHAHGPSRTY